LSKTNVQETSLEAYIEIVNESLNERQKAVMMIFYENPSMNFSNTELARELEVPINTVTPRVYELRGRGKNNQYKGRPILVEAMKRICKVTGKRVIAWQINPSWSRSENRRG